MTRECTRVASVGKTTRRREEFPMERAVRPQFFRRLTMRIQDITMRVAGLLRRLMDFMHVVVRPGGEHAVGHDLVHRDIHRVPVDSRECH